MPTLCLLNVTACDQISQTFPTLFDSTIKFTYATSCIAWFSSAQIRYEVFFFKSCSSTTDFTLSYISRSLSEAIGTLYVPYFHFCHELLWTLIYKIMLVYKLNPRNAEPTHSVKRTPPHSVKQTGSPVPKLPELYKIHSIIWTLVYHFCKIVRHI